jgi:hypothetical protein
MLALVAGLLGQLAWHAREPARLAEAADLPPAPAERSLLVLALGDPLVLSKVLMLWLQSYDNQPGISVPFSRLDYDDVSAWLDRILALDPRAQYPLLAASRVYAALPDPARKRHMFEFVHDKFLEAPNLRWPWLAHAAIEAKHRLKDMALALRYARALTEHATGPEVPAWVRDMSVVVLEDMAEYGAALYLAKHLLDSGRVTDPHEIRFLEAKLEALRTSAQDGGR